METKKTFYIAIVLSTLLSAAPAATAPEPESDARREQLRQEAQASYLPIEQTLKVILEKANLNQRLSAEQTQKALALLEMNKRNAVLYETPKKAGYMLLQSWVSYYQNDPVNNLNWAVRACKEDPTNGDAWASQTLFSLLYSHKPVEPQALLRKPQTPTTESRRQRPPRPQRPRRNGDETPLETGISYNTSAPYGQPGTLVFSPDKLNKEFLRERFALMEFKTTDDKKITYSPAADILCLLVWRAEEASDPNTPGLTPQKIEPAMELSLASPLDTMGTSGPSLEDQQAYFEVMTEALAAKKEVKFLEINTNSSAGTKQALANHRPVCPLVAAADPQSGAAAFLRLNVKTPFMAIIDKEGKVKYAGPAEGFAPAFILTHITGVAIDLKAFQPTPQAATPMMGGMMPGEMPLMMMPGMYDPNQRSPLDDPNRPQMKSPAAPQTQAPAEKKYRELPLEQQMEAEKKLSYIDGLFIKGSRAKIQSYKRGVDMCREIIRDYPGTKYADQAQQLLRQVPENKRATYNITNAELGL